MANEILTTIDNQGVARISLNRPEKRNAFDDKTIIQFRKKLHEIEQNDNVRVLVLSGNGDTFSSGADLIWMKSMIHFTQEENIQDSLCLANLMQQLYTCSKPTIARINGSAYGGALGLIACCDIAISVKEAEFCFSEVKLGIAPAVISPYVISAIGPRQAKKLFLTGEIFSSSEAEKMGIVHRCVSANELDNTIDHQISQLLKGGPSAQSEIKHLVHAFSNINSDKTQDFERLKQETANIIAKLRTSKEGQEGINAFLGKRRAEWQ